MLHRQRVQFAFQQLIAEARDQAVYGPVKEQFGDAIRALTDAEQDSKELKSAKRHALVEQIVNTAQLPFPSRGEPDEQGNAPLDPTDALGRARRSWTRSTRRSSGPRSRSTSADPTAGRRPRSGTCHPRSP